MRLAALYDIHGNLPALEAVLREVREAAIDQIVVGGDVVPGPMVRETLSALVDVEIPILYILGNSEAAVLAQMRGMDPGPMPDAAREVIAWSAQELQGEHESLFTNWPKTCRLQVPGIGAVLFCHGTPRHENEIFTRLTSERRLLDVFENLGVDVVVCGHTHMQFDRVIGGVRVVNAGSVGMPFGAPGADWLLLGSDIEFRHTQYDLLRAADRIRRTRYPQAEEFAARSVLQPPSEASMLEALGRAELRYEPATPSPPN
jgi:putative phosphoesterase